MQGQQTTAFDHHKHCCGWWNRGISWRAIFAGAFVAIGLGLLLHLFSVAWGLSVYATSPEGMTALAIGALIGLFVAIIIIMFLAGFTAGAYGRSCCSKHNSGIIYGFTTWTLAILLTALLTPHVGNYIANYYNFIQKPAIIMTAIANAERTMAATEKAVETTPAEMALIAQKTTATSTFVLFFLFFVGALASCFGGYCGVACCGKRGGCDHHLEGQKII